MLPRKISKLEMKTRQRLAEIYKEAEVQGITLTTVEGRKAIFKKFPAHNDPAMVAAKIRIIQQHNDPIPIPRLSDYIKLEG